MLIAIGIILFKGKIYSTIIKVLYAFFYIDIIDHPLSTVVYIIQKMGGYIWNSEYITLVINLLDIIVILCIYQICLRTKIKRYWNIDISNGFYCIGIIIATIGSGINAYTTIVFNQTRESLTIPIYILLSVLIEIIYILGIVMSFLDVLRVQYKNELDIKNKYLDISKAYYSNIESQMHKIQKLKHDMNHQLYIVRYYLSEKNIMKQYNTLIYIPENYQKKIIYIM